MLDRYTMSQTHTKSKPRSDRCDQHGGKILEKAKAMGNSMDRPNSICLNEVLTRPNGNGTRFKDLLRARTITTLSNVNPLTVREEVERKQRELAELAKLKGINDKSVMDKQLILVRSRLFRMYATMLIKDKAGSQTPGIDKEKYDKEKETTFDGIIEFLRETTRYPNKYKAAPIKRV